MVEGARCWADEAEKSRFSSAVVQITFMLAWCAKFLAILHTLTVARRRPFRCVHTRKRVRIHKKSTGGPPAHRGQPAHRRSSARFSECFSSERFKNTDVLKKPQWLDNARSKYRNTPAEHRTRERGIRTRHGRDGEPGAVPGRDGQ